MDDATRKVLAESWEPDLHSTGHDRVAAKAPVLPERLGEKRYIAHQEARARIAACAPELARLLLAGEWADNSDGEYFPRCPWCRNRESEEFGDASEPGKHGSKCPLVACLQKAGLR